ncbi:MAG TPA: lipopolysaccharide biosynthesis protein [Thermoanaerobaculia bacterium]|nr:lipopolysaccharide biosynthesis protein [Thermoanaerobaculia bacterium]
MSTPRDDGRNGASSEGTSSPREPVRSSLVEKTSWSAAAGLAAGAGGAVSAVVIARMLGPSGTGEAAYAQWLAFTAGQIAGLALPQVAVRYLAAEGGRDASVGLTRWLVERGAVLALPAAALAWAVGHLGGQRGRPDLQLVTSLLAAGMTLSALAQGILAGRQAFRRLSLLSTLAAVVQVVSVGLGAAFGGGAGAITGFVLGQAVFGTVLPGRRRGALRPGPALRKRIGRFAFYSWLATVLSLFAWSRFEFYFLERSAGAGAVAMFSVALTVALVAVQPATLLGGAILPHIAELVAEKKLDAGRAAYAAATRLVAFFVFPACFGLATTAPIFVPLVFGERFADAVIPTAIVVAFSAFGAASTAGNALIYALERSRFLALAGVNTTVLAAVTYALVIPRWGPTGAAVARSVLQLLGVTVGTIYISRVLNAAVPLGRVARSAAAAALAALPCGAVIAAGGRSWLVLAASIATMAAGYAAASRWLRVLDPDDIQYLTASLTSFPRMVREPLRALMEFLTG